MNGGRVEQVGTPQEVYLHPRTRFVASFLGAMNWIDGVGIRPEAVRLSSASPGCKATVASAVFLGPVLHIEARLESGELVTAQLAPGCTFQPEQTVYVSW